MQNLCIKNTKQLFNAIIRRDIEKIKECLKRDVNLAYQGQGKNNAFHLFFQTYAIKYRNFNHVN